MTIPNHSNFVGTELGDYILDPVILGHSAITIKWFNAGNSNPLPNGHFKAVMYAMMYDGKTLDEATADWFESKPDPEFRTPDPPEGTLLPIPNEFALVRQIAIDNPELLKNSCQNDGGTWEFMDLVVTALRKKDTRWGYNCKRGNCDDPSQDVAAYHAGAGPEVVGVAETRTVDVIEGHCRGNPKVSWLVHKYVPGPGEARWIYPRS